MSVSDKGGYLADLGSSFTEDAPRPPVPGEEGDLVPGDGCRQSAGNLGFFSSKGDSLKCEAPSATPRRPDLDLGYEPEGSASPTPPYLKWAESLHSLLDDQDGIGLFRMFLKQEDCADVLDFWFACSGFRKLEASEGNEEKKVKLAKAIYKKYILDSGAIVSQQIKPATKSFIKDCIARLHIDPAMFDQAQTEIQTAMEENTYPLFLKSDIYLEYTRTGGESPKLYGDHSPASGNGKSLSGYLPTLNEDEEWRCEQEQQQQQQQQQQQEEQQQQQPECEPAVSSRLAQRLLMEAPASNERFQDSPEYRHASCREPMYYAHTGYALAPATSTNDSEQQSMSSDAETVSLTDSSLDGVPPYRQRKQQRREMHESAKANGRVPLPHIPRTDRIPKDIHVEPERFAAELISKLEGVLRQREAEEKLEERLKRVRLEEDGDEVGPVVATLPSHRLPPSAYPQNYNARYVDVSYGAGGPFIRDAHEENPESILDEHVRRVMKTPGCQSPGNGRHSPKSRSPDGFQGGRGTAHSGAAALQQPPQQQQPPPPPAQSKHSFRHGAKGESGHVCHHKHVHHAHGGKAREQAESEAARVHGCYPWTPVETGHYGSKNRSYADGMGCGPAEHAPYSSKFGAQCKRTFKKLGEDVRGAEVPAPAEEMEKKQKILLWLMEGQKELVQHKRSSYGSCSGSKRAAAAAGAHEGPPRLFPGERSGSVHPFSGGGGGGGGGGGAQLRNSTVLPSHPFIQDPTMPPNPAPSPLIQLEEVRRRLEEEKIKSGTLQPKQRYVMEVIQRGRSAVRPPTFPPLSVVPAVSDSELSEHEHKATRKAPCENITVAYYFCEELIPYRTSVRGSVVTLGQFKELLTKKGNYRYYFKKVSDEFDCGVVFEEVREEDAILPIFEEKIIGKVEKID